MKIYEKVDTLPTGRASDHLIHGCIVLEGGAFRGLYTMGVLDALMEEDINMDCTIGVSAGALSGMAYVSGQIGYSGRLNLTHRQDSNYVGLGAMKRDHGITGFSYAFEELFQEGEGFDTERFNDERRRFIAVATNVETGEAEYFEKGKTEFLQKGVQASATVPYISEPVEIDGNHYLDGGLSDKIPYQWPLRNGYDKIIVVRTRDEEYRSKIKRPLFLNQMYRDHPEALQDLEEMAPKYNIAIEDIEMLKERGRIYVIAPKLPVTISRFEADMDKLGDLYWEGYNETKEQIDAIKAYLTESK